MAQILDSIVNININDAISGVTTAGVNTIALVGAKGSDSDGVAGTFSDLEAIGAAFGKKSELYAMAEKYFAQDTQPSRVVCIPVTSISAAKTELEAALALDFYHVCVATGDASVTGMTAALKGLHDFAAANFKMVHVQVNDATEGKTAVIAAAADLKEYGADRVALYLHTEGLDDEGTTATGEFLNVAIVATRCALDSARGTFAHKTASSTTADSYTKTIFDALIAAGVNVYTMVSGVARLFMGTTCSDGDFIDNKVKDDWIRFNVQSAIFRLLGEANDGHGVTYDDAGIGAVVSTILAVLANASDTSHQYIMDGYTVSAPDYSYIKTNLPDELRKRNLPLVTGRYSRMNSIHTVKDVTLNVTL